MSDGPILTDRLDSWKEIASHLGRTVRTAIRWEQSKGLPVHRVPGGTRQAVFAYKSELNRWLESDFSPDGESLPPIELLPTISATEQGISRVASVRSKLSQGLEKSVSPALRIWPVWITVGTMILVAAIYASASLLYSHPIVLTGAVQLTSDGLEKVGLLTNGENLYFSEYRGGHVHLMMVSVDGGPIQPVPTSIMDVVPADISVDGKRLLAISMQDQSPQGDTELWVVSLPGGETARVGNIVCHSAAWSADGKRIAYLSHTDLFLANRDGSESRVLHSFDGIPQYLRWRPDGTSIRVAVSSSTNENGAFFDVELGKETNEDVAMVPLNLTVPGSSAFWTLDRWGNTLSVGQRKGELQALYQIHRAGALRPSTFALDSTNLRIQGYGYLALDPHSKKVFALGQTGVSQSGLPTRDRNIIVAFDPKSNAFRPFLPGLKAIEVNFDHRGNRIAYVSSEDRSLWISRADGSDARAIVAQADDIELPRWSPDDEWIAFMARVHDRPWRIFIIPSGGGTMREVAKGNDSQGAPTWSPDGKYISYGSVNCQKQETCAIHTINVATGEVMTIPGSHSLETARWSPDGRFIAALYPRGREVRLFDFVLRKWETISTDMTGNDLSWSPDSQYVYAIRPGGERPGVFRITVKTHEEETAVDLTNFAKMGVQLNTWFGLTPDGSILVQQADPSSEVYALEFRRNWP